MTPYHYTAYDEIPENVRNFVIDTCALEYIVDMDIEDINDYLDEVQVFYTANGLKIEDFLDD